MKAKPNSQKIRFTDQNQNNSIEASQPTKSQKEEEKQKIRDQFAKVVSQERNDLKASELIVLFNKLLESEEFRSDVKELRFGTAQEDAGQLLNPLLEALYEKQPFVEKSQLAPNNQNAKVKPKNPKFDKQIVIPLEIFLEDVGGNITIQDLIKNYTKEEVLDEACSAEFDCENEVTEIDSTAQNKVIKIQTKKTLSLSVDESAEEIFFQLKRFITNNPSTESSSDFVATKNLREVSLKNSLIDDENLKDVLEFDVEGKPDQKKRFKPTGFIWHGGEYNDEKGIWLFEGGINSGHYMTYALELDKEDQQSWYLYNDGQKSKVRNQGEEFQLFQERINQAYIIKYSAIDDSNKPNIPKSSDQNCGTKNTGNTCWANAVIALVGSSSLAKNRQHNISNKTTTPQQQRLIAPTKSTQKQIAKEKEDEKLKELQDLLDQAQKIAPSTESPSYKKSDTIHFDLGDFFREKTAATKTIKFKINYDADGKKTGVEKEHSNINEVQTAQEYMIKTKADETERTTTFQLTGEIAELNESTKKQKLKEVEVTGPTFEYQEAKPKTVKTPSNSDVEIKICTDSPNKTFPIITPEVLSLDNKTQIVDSTGASHESFKKSYYSKFGGSKFSEKDAGDGNKIFGNADLFMSSFRNCVFENVDFSQVKNFGTIGFYGCKFGENCVFPSGFTKEHLENKNLCPTSSPRQPTAALLSATKVEAKDKNVILILNY